MKILLLFVFLLASQSVKADEFVYPDYLDDEEYDHCVQLSGGMDACAKDESQRVLRNVKLLYKNLLADKRLNNWNGSFEANRDMLRDMYESWTAFRNRICSLNSVAAKYTGPIVDPKVACTLFQNFNHQDYLNQLLHTLNPNNYPKQLPNVAGGNVYLEVDHDLGYESCIKEKKAADDCLKEEIDRTTKHIKNHLATVMQNRTTAQWNNGPDIKNGNLIDMFDSWVAFRNRMCSLTAYVQKTANPQNPASFDLCIQFYNEALTTSLQGILVASVSVLDEEMIEVADNDDGGKEEGLTFTPLKRRVPTEIDAKAEAPEDDGETPQKAETVSAPRNLDKRGRQLPSWAVQQ